jgi:hypothetical protein
LIAMPVEAEPVQRSYLVSVLSVGLQVIRLQRLSRHGRIGTEISDIQASLAAGDLPKLRVVLDAVDQEIASIPDTLQGARGRLRARSALLAVGKAVNRQSEYFEATRHELRRNKCVWRSHIAVCVADGDRIRDYSSFALGCGRARVGARYLASSAL